MSKFQVSYTETAIVFINNKTNKSDKLELLEVMDNTDAIKALEKENTARESGSRAAVSLLNAMLDNPRFDAYKGTTPLDKSIPTELKSALREVESEFIKPLFVKAHEEKGQTAATIAKKWDEYIGALRAGSSYAVAKGKVLNYFAYIGQRPQTESGKLLTVSAMDKLIANARDGVQKPVKLVSDRLIEFSKDIKDVTDPGKLGSPASAIAALKAMLAVYEKLQQANAEAAAVTHEHTAVGDVSTAAHAVTNKARRVKKEEATA